MLQRSRDSECKQLEAERRLRIVSAGCGRCAELEPRLCLSSAISIIHHRRCPSPPASSARSASLFSCLQSLPPSTCSGLLASYGRHPGLFSVSLPQSSLALIDRQDGAGGDYDHVRSLTLIRLQTGADSICSVDNSEPSRNGDYT